MLRITCQTSSMRNLTATLCLTIAVLLGSAGVSKSADYAIALREWTPLAEQGDAYAQYNLGLMYERGQGVPQDYKIATKWYKLSAEQGDVDAQHKLNQLTKPWWKFW